VRHPQHPDRDFTTAGLKRLAPAPAISFLKEDKQGGMPKFDVEDARV